MRWWRDVPWRTVEEHPVEATRVCGASPVLASGVDDVAL
jgi:hypothetical protein